MSKPLRKSEIQEYLHSLHLKVGLVYMGGKNWFGDDKKWEKYFKLKDDYINK